MDNLKKISTESLRDTYTKIGKELKRRADIEDAKAFNAKYKGISKLIPEYKRCCLKKIKTRTGTVVLYWSSALETDVFFKGKDETTFSYLSKRALKAKRNKDLAFVSELVKEQNKRIEKLDKKLESLVKGDMSKYEDLYSELWDRFAPRTDDFDRSCRLY